MIRVGLIGALARSAGAVWLSVQLLFIAASPSWGLFVPHEHESAEPLTAAAWQEHWEEHRLGHHVTINVDETCGLLSLQLLKSDRHSILSLVEFHESDSIFSGLGWVGSTPAEVILKAASDFERIAPEWIFMGARFLAPLDPPPEAPL